MARKLPHNLCLLILSVILIGPAALAGEAPIAPDGELAGWLWPAAFSLYAARTAVWDFPAAYLIDTPRVGAAILKRKDADTAAELVRILQDPYVTVKNPIAADLRRRTGQDFGYADSASRLKRRQAVAKWAAWARKQGGSRKMEGRQGFSLGPPKAEGGTTLILYCCLGTGRPGRMRDNFWNGMTYA